MTVTHLSPKMILRVALALVIVLTASLLSFRGSAAQRTDDPRFGLVNAFDAPQAAYDSGASWEVLTLHWDELQPSGPTDWDAPAALEQWLGNARASGREVVAVLVGTPAWATDGNPGTGVPRGLYLPNNDPGNLWASFVSQAVSYYGARGINHWVIWDLPDIPADSPGSRWDGTTEDYYQMVKAAYGVAKGVNPNAKIHLGGISDTNPAWFKRFLEVVVGDPTAPANDYYFDVATVHVFYSPESVYILAANPSYLMEQQGIPLKPVWINQTNARPGVDPSVYPPDTRFRQHPNITPEQQAAFIVQAYALGFAAGAERIAVYRLADNLDEDEGQAFGLVRANGDPRPAFAAYQLVTQLFSGFVLARRVDEQTHPLIEYVRLTSASKVVHVAWARSAQTATLTIPARSTQATLYDLDGNRWLLAPEGGVYNVVVGGADCNDPTTVGGCLIGGSPWILVEEGVQNPLDTVAPTVTTEIGGTLPTPDPGPFLTATALAMPTATPTATETPTATITPLPSELPTLEASLAAPSQEAAALTAVPSQTPMPTPIPPPGTGVGPQGFEAALPYVLMGLGGVVIIGGAFFFIVGLRRAAPTPAIAEEAPLTAEAAEAPEEAPPAGETAEVAEEPPTLKRTGRRKKGSGES